MVTSEAGRVEEGEVGVGRLVEGRVEVGRVEVGRLEGRGVGVERSVGWLQALNSRVSRSKVMSRVGVRRLFIGED
jgi:hypothetical protein